MHEGNASSKSTDKNFAVMWFMHKKKRRWNKIEKKKVKKIDTDKIEGEYIIKNTDPDKKKIIFSTVIWYDPKIGRYYFKSESDMNGNVVSGDVVSHKLIQDLLSISKWKLKDFGKLDDNKIHVSSGGIELNKKLNSLHM